MEKICIAIFEAASEGLLVVDRHGKIQVANPRMKELFGFSQEELVGNEVSLLVPGSMDMQHSSYMERYFSNPTRRSMGMGMELAGKRKDGSSFPVEISLNHFEADGETYVIAMITDITARKEAEAAQKALDAERKLNTLKSRFVSLASHEFRTPLSTILTSLSLLLRYTGEDQKDRREKHANRIQSAVHNLTGILDDFLSLDKLEAGAVECNPELINVPQTFAEVVEEMQTIAKAGQEISYRHEGRDQTIADGKLLRNILVNLLSNAIKYSGEGDPVKVYSNLENGTLTIIVRDEGIGIPEHEQKHLFERFYRARNAAHFQGTGLGLNIVQKYLELMRGKIDFRSKENEGSEFTLMIPVA